MDAWGALPYSIRPAYDREAVRDQVEAQRHDAVLDELRALRAPRLMVFVDTMNLIEGARELTSRGYPEIDPYVPDDRALRCAGLYPWAVVSAFRRFHHIRSYWYDATVATNRDNYGVQKAVHEGVRSAPYCELVLGRHGGRREGKRQKGVDVRLAVGMLEHAHLGNYDCAALVGGDEDFVPAVEAVKATGRQVVCLTFTWQLASDGLLVDACDHVLDLAAALRDRYRQEAIDEGRI
ncbi:MAG: NYN domain-containing protein [Armatimonadetes bacterium]|nr:NYN domain-containing protein [Armatimonadota bacterium]